GVVEDGALWSEENLPAETVLWGVIGAAASRQPQRPADAAQVWQRFVAAFARQAPGKVIQLGGKATSGRGLVRCLF
ncbi:MAG TPA: type III-B CRISPR module RAMP protein Cmr4, partial [Accumulibacter sp.]|nr:type III-B CRISPR module RAMP protein Cmr4 [Accumulibacter sp.]